MYDLRQNSTQNYVRLALDALNLCKISAKLDAKYIKPTPKFNAELCKISVDCVELMWDQR